MISSTDKQKRPTPEQLDFLQEAIAASSALAAADRLGVLARLAAGPADPVTLARDCTISERGARLLLAALISLGLIEEASDGSYSAAASDLADWPHDHALEPPRRVDTRGPADHGRRYPWRGWGLVS